MDTAASDDQVECKSMYSSRGMDHEYALAEYGHASVVFRLGRERYFAAPHLQVKRISRANLPALL